MKYAIIIKPIKLQEYTCKQSNHDIVPTLPLRGVLLAPSGSGKPVLLRNLILNVHRGCYERIYKFQSIGSCRPKMASSKRVSRENNES